VISFSNGPLQAEQLEFTFESRHARCAAELFRAWAEICRDIAHMIASYSPNKSHQQWMKSKDEEAKHNKRTLLSETEMVSIM
jgi:hypothetical protein